MKFRLNLSWRLMMALWSMSALTCIVGAFFSAQTVVDQRDQFLYETLPQSTDSFVDMAFADLSADREISRMPSIVASALSFLQFERIVRVFDNEGKLLFSNGDKSQNEVLDAIFTSTPSEKIKTITLSDQEYFVVQHHYKLLSGEGRSVQVAAQALDLATVLKSSYLTYLVFFFLLFVLSFFIAKFFAKALLMPVQKIATHLREFSRLQPRQWATISQKSEDSFLGEISGAINQLVSSVQVLNLANQNMTQSLAHEIRTPLTVMLGEIETLNEPETSDEEWDKAIGRFSLDIHRIDTITRTILELSRRPQLKNTLHFEEVGELVETLQRCIQHFERAFDMPVLLKVAPGVLGCLSVDSNLFFILIDNFLRNSVKHSVNRTLPIEIDLKLDSYGEILLTLEDSGPGLPPDIIQALNESKIHPGFGVGLNLSREVCHATGWQLHFENRGTGGLRITILLSSQSHTSSFNAAPQQSLTQTL